MRVRSPLATIKVMRRYYQNDQEVGLETHEGELQMDPQQQDYYKQLIGDGQASITVSRTLGEKDFGSGGDCFLSVTLTCDQSQQYVDYAIGLAKQLVNQKIWEHHAEMKQELVRRGILKS